MSVALVGAIACSDSSVTSVGVDDEIAALLSVQPSPGSLGVTVGATVVISFDHPIALGMEEFAVLHEGSLTGPEVDGLWELSDDRTELTFTPAEELKPGTMYVIHVGGGMMNGYGNVVNLGRHGIGMGGQWATQQMMTGGMGSGMGGNGGMMGEGWRHPTNGTFGMMFEFTTEV